MTDSVRPSKRLAVANQQLDAELGKQSNQDLRHKADDQTMRCELLSDKIADLNRQAMSNQLRIAQLNAELGQKQADLNKLNDLKTIHLNVNEVKELNRLLDLELRDKSVLVDLLNRAKDFPETTNSQLLLKNGFSCQARRPRTKS